jgi:hypothetical protein
MSTESVSQGKETPLHVVPTLIYVFKWKQQWLSFLYSCFWQVLPGSGSVDVSPTPTLTLCFVYNQKSFGIWVAVWLSWLPLQETCPSIPREETLESVLRNLRIPGYVIQWALDSSIPGLLFKPGFCSFSRRQDFASIISSLESMIMNSFSPSSWMTRRQQRDY